jgi:hypothetical protein
LNLGAIESSLRAVQQAFPLINRDLIPHREKMTEEILANMLAGYTYVDGAIQRGTDFFSFGNVRHLLELNTLVLCGTDPDTRKQFAQHIRATEKQFYEQDGGGIGSLVEWLDHHHDESPWKRAAGAYIQLLSQPQLFIEGNHRTGALVMSYLLARENRPPFVLTVDNAKAYFDPSTLVRKTRKQSMAMLIRLPKLKKRFAKLLQEDANGEYLIHIG